MMMIIDYYIIINQGSYYNQVAMLIGYSILCSWQYHLTHNDNLDVIFYNVIPEVVNTDNFFNFNFF